MTVVTPSTDGAAKAVPDIAKAAPQSAAKMAVFFISFLSRSVVVSTEGKAKSVLLYPVSASV